MSADQQAKLNGGHQFVVLNDGQTVDGRLYDVGGTVPLKIVFDTPSGRRDDNFSDNSGQFEVVISR